MPDLTELLERTTPRHVAPVDVTLLARRARRRRLSRRVAVAVPALALVGLLGMVLAPGSGGGRLLVPAGPIEDVIGEPIGRWVQASSPPFSARGQAFGFHADDGRVVVWGGSLPNDGGREGGGTLADGGVYDTETNSWEPIPPAPVPGDLSFHRAQSAGNRLAVLGVDGAGALHGAVYDLGTREWTRLPTQDEIRVVVDGMGWTGETLALVRVDPGVDEANGRYADWSVRSPLTLRWSFGSERWVEGSPPPLRARFGAGAAFDGRRLALWGGTTHNPRLDAGPGDATSAAQDQRVGDGAIYEVDADRWVPMAKSPLIPTIHPALSWHGGRLLVGGGLTTLYNASGFVAELAAFDPEANSWVTLPAAPVGGPAEMRPSARRYSVGIESVLTVERQASPGGVQPGWFLDGTRWREAPYQDLHRSGPTTVATTMGADTQPGDRLSVRVSTSGHPWRTAPEAPFTNRAGSTVVLVDRALVVVGGFERSTYEVVPDAWVLDMTP